MTTQAKGQTTVETQPLVKITEMDHIVLRVRDVEASLRFYMGMMGLEGERLEEFRSGNVPFPSVRLNADTIIDIFPFPDMEPIGDGPRNQDHFCMVIEPTDMDELAERFKAMGIKVRRGPLPRWGAHGMATSVYISDPDDNEVELRHY